MNAENRTEIRRISLILPSPWTVAVILGLSIVLWAGTAVSQSDADAYVAWRIRILEAVTVSGPKVTLGEIAEPVGDMPPETWQLLAGRELWDSPAEKGRPMNMPRHKLKDQIRRALGPEMEALCLFSGSLAIQRGGKVLREADLHQILVKSLTPQMAAMPGEAALSDVRLPAYIFLTHAGQEVAIDPVSNLVPGRVSLRVSVLDLDKSVTRRITASAFLDVWGTVPAAKEPLSRGDALTPDKIMFVRKNLAYVRGELWDGIGGPHRIKRSVGAEQIIYVSDLEHVPLIVKGGQVTLLYQRGTVRLEVPAEAMADGAPGQLLAVRNLQSGSVVKGTVRDKRTVSVN